MFGARREFRVAIEPRSRQDVHGPLRTSLSQKTRPARLAGRTGQRTSDREGVYCSSAELCHARAHGTPAVRKIDRVLAALGVPRAHFDAYCDLFVNDRPIERPGRFPAWRSYSGYGADRDGNNRPYEGVRPCPGCEVTQETVLRGASSPEERAALRKQGGGVAVSGGTVSARCECGLWWRATGPEVARRALKVRDAEWMTEGREDTPTSKGFPAILSASKLADHLCWRTDVLHRVVSLRWAPVVHWIVFDFDLRRLLTTDERAELRRRLQVSPETARLSNFVADLPTKVEEMKGYIRRVMDLFAVPTLPFKSSPSGGVHLYVPIHATLLERARQWATHIAMSGVSVYRVRLGSASPDPEC